MRIARALISVSDKTGVVEMARQLSRLEVEILSTGGTARALREAGIRVVPVAEFTGFPEILDGRVKTLHPRIHAALLARYDQPEHRQVLEEHKIPPITLTVVNLYPFQQTIQDPVVDMDEALEQIDIGGPTLIRASAKNFHHITVVVDPDDYAAVLTEMKTHSGETTLPLRQRLAGKAFAHTAAYDAAVAGFFERQSEPPGELPQALQLSLLREASLRYGENPHQRGALYRPRFSPPQRLLAARQLQGKPLSFNNFLDLNAAWSLVREFEETVCVIIKHNNPCGAAAGSTPVEAYRQALACDPVSAFGSIIGFNRAVDGPTAEELASLFVEAVIAPEFDVSARDILATKKNLRLMEMKGAPANTEPQLELRSIEGGFLLQDQDVYYTRDRDLNVVTRRPPTAQETVDLLFAWHVCKHVKSNAIVYARDRQTLGIGAGQMSRVDSVRLAARKAVLPLDSSVMASDAFFPFRDGVEEAVRAGIRAVIQPGGSVRDPEVIQAADELGIAMTFTGVRHFKH